MNMGKINNKSTKADMEAYIAELEARLAEVEKASTSVQNPMPIRTKTTDDVTLVYCSDSLGYAKISNMEFNFTRFGEEFRVPRYQFDELVGKYRSWFDRGIFAVSSEDIGVAVSKGIPTVDDFALDAKTLMSVGNMSVQEIEALWNSLEKHEHKMSLVTFVKRKFIENDPKYRNREKIDLFNRLTNGGFAREQDELNGRIKINQTDM